MDEIVKFAVYNFSSHSISKIEFNIQQD